MKYHEVSMYTNNEKSQRNRYMFPHSCKRVNMVLATCTSKKFIVTTLENKKVFKVLI